MFKMKLLPLYLGALTLGIGAVSATADEIADFFAPISEYNV